MFSHHGNGAGERSRLRMYEHIEELKPKFVLFRDESFR
jgi:hypothetical protein